MGVGCFDERECLSVCLSVYTHISQTTRPHFTKSFVNVASGRASAGVATSYVLPVLWMTSCVFIMGRIWRSDTTAATSQQCCERAVTPAAWYWLRPVLDDVGRQLYT